MLLAFGFGNLAMLGWLAAAAAPILIHLWTRTRYREVPWAAMEFLLAAMRKNARRIRLQQWLLLAVRTLLIAIVVLAAAEPFWETLPIFSSQGPAHRVLVIDGSFSMGYRLGERDLFGEAKQLASRVVNESNVGDAFSLVLMGEPARSILGQPLLDRATIVNEIAALALPHGKGDLTSALSTAQTCIDQARREYPHLSRHEIIFLTDLGQPTWQIASSAPAEGAQATVQQLEQLAKSAAMYVVVLGEAGAANVGVTRLESATSFAPLDSAVQLRGTVANFDDQPRSELPVELLVDGAVAATRTIDVPGHGESGVSFSHTFRSPGTKRVALRVGGDGLQIDNTRWLALPVKNELHVLCVAGKPGAADYVAAALNPELPDAAGQSIIRPLVVPDGQLLDLELGRFDCIFLCNVARFTGDEAAVVDRFVRQGGGLIVFLGDQVSGDEYNRLLAQESWLPARLGDVVTEPGYGIDPLDYRHPIVAPFRGQERTGLLTTPVYRYFRLELPAESDAQTVLALASGDPLIVASSVGQGRTLLVATAGSLGSIDAATGQPWTTMPAWPSFLPIVREMLLYAISGQQQNQELLVGAPLTGVVDQPAGTVAISRPDGTTQEVAKSDTLQGTGWSYDQTDISGIYMAHLDVPRGESSTSMFAVNVDPVESDLTRVDPQDLPKALIVRDRWQSGEAGAAQAGLAARSQVHRWLLYGALFLAIVEVFLGWLFGRGTA